MEAFETFEHAGFTCELHQDVDAESPDSWDNLGTLYKFRPSSWRNDPPGEDAPGDVQEAWEREVPGLVVRYLRRFHGQYAVLFQLQDYGSGGARIHPLADDEDAIASGYLSTTRERFEQLCGAWGYKPADFAGSSETWLRHTLEQELSNWDAWVEGRVVGFVVCDPASGEVVDSCWGFYPDDEGDGLEHVRGEARAAAESEQRYRARRAVETAAGWATAHRILSAGWSA